MARRDLADGRTSSSSFDCAEGGGVGPLALAGNTTTECRGGNGGGDAPAAAVLPGMGRQQSSLSSSSSHYPSLSPLPSPSPLPSRSRPPSRSPIPALRRRGRRWSHRRASPSRNTPPAAPMPLSFLPPPPPLHPSPLPPTRCPASPERWQKLLQVQRRLRVGGGGREERGMGAAGGVLRR